MSTKVIDIYNTLNFVSDYNNVGLTAASNRLTVDSGGLLTIFNTTQSENSSVGALVLQNGGLSINALTNATSVSNGGALTVAGGASIAGDLIVGGSISYSNAAAASSTFAYLTLTATDQSIDVANGALVVFGGISVQTSADATSITSGGALTLAGGLAVYKSLYVGGTSNLQDITSTNITANNVRVTNALATNVTTTTLSATSATIPNLVSTNITSTTAIVTGGLRATGNSNTIGSIFTTGGNVGIGSTPTVGFRTDINGTLRASATSGTLHNFIGNNSSEFILVQNTNASGGSSIRFLNNSGTSQASFGFNNGNSTVFQNGVYLNSIASVPINIAAGNKTSNPVIFNASDNSVSITATTDAADTSSGALKVSGGVGIVGDLYVGGEVYVNSPMNVTINNTRYSSNSSTGAMQLVGGISIDVKDTTNSNATSYTSGGGITLNGGLAVAQDTFLGGVLDVRGGSNNMNPIKLQSIQISSNYNNGASTVIQSGNATRDSSSYTPIVFSGWNDQANPKLTINSSNVVVPTGSNLIAANSSHTIGNIFTTGGNVGIASTSPSASLHINTSNTFGQLYLGNTVQNRKVVLYDTGNNLNQFYGFGIAFGTLRYQVEHTAASHIFYAATSATTSNELLRITGQGNAVIAGSTSTTAVSAANLYNVNQSATNITVGVLNASTGITAANINFTGELYKNGTLYVSSQWLGTNGNILYYGTTGSGYLVGIGTSNPTNNLDVVGSARISTSVTTGALFSTNQTTTNSRIVNLSAGTSNISNLTAGNINFTGSLSQNGAPYIGSQWTGTTGTLYYGTAGSSMVGINTTSPQYTLDVNGTIRATGISIIGTTNSLNSTTGQYVYNSMSLTSTENVSSFTQGGGLTVAGGLAVGKSMAVGQSISLGGISNDIVGTFSASNNVSTPTAITNLIFPTANIRSFSLNIQIQLLANSGADNRYAYYTIDGIQNTSGWAIDDTFIGDVTGINFSIDNTGQIYYTSTNITNWISCTLNYKATSYSISGNYIQPAPTTSGNFLVTQNLTVQGTTDANSASYGSIVTAGGVGIGKSVNVGGSVILNNVCSTSSGTFDAANGPVTTQNITGLAFATNVYRSFTTLMSVTVARSAGGNYNAQFTIEGIQRDAGWYIYVSTLGDTIDITFNITAAGQLQYSTSTTHSNWLSTKLNYQVTAIYVTGGFNTFTLPSGTTTISEILTITNTTDSTSDSTGALIVEGGMGIQKTLNIGDGLNTPNVNLGVSSLFSGSFIAANNISSATNVTGLSFATANIRYFEAKIVITITRTDNSTLDEIITLRGNNNDSGWQLFIENIGDTSGITFTITSGGQVQYTSTNVASFSSSIFRYSAQQYTKTGTYTSIPVNTSGSYIMSSGQFTTTTNAVYGTSVGGLQTLGGMTIEKDLVVKGIINAQSSTSANVTINTDSLWGNIELYGTSGGYIDFKNTSGDNFDARIKNIGSNNSLGFFMDTGETTGMSLTSSGTLLISGDIGAFASISDRTLKTNITNISPDTALDTIKTLRPVTFNWKDDIFNVSRRGEFDSGFIAQEVEEVIPHAVGEYNTIDYQNTYKNMRHERIIPYLVGSIQKLEGIITELKDRIEFLESK